MACAALLYDGRAALSTWLYTIARNTCLTAVRAETYRRPAGDIRIFEPHAEPIRPENIALQSAIDKLPEIQRTILTLFYFEDRNIAEVASCSACRKARSRTICTAPGGR